MIVEELQSLVTKAQRQHNVPLYIKNLLKENLQIYILNFIYLNKNYNKNFIFTGGTCLRNCFGLNRLSEDLDFDLKKPIDVLEFKTSMENYFKKEYLYEGIQISILQRGSQLLLKFPVLKKLKLATDSESDLLYVKIDLSPMISKIYDQQTTLKNINHFNYLVIHYDLPSLMTGKLNAILTRNRLAGKENIKVVKGRDYFDLLWFLEKKVIPNIPRLNDLLPTVYSMTQLISMIDAKVEEVTTTLHQYFKLDLLPFIDDSRFLDTYLENYRKIYDSHKMYLLEQ